MICCVIALAVAYVASVYLRTDNFNLTVGSENLEATYHVLWTLKSLDDSPINAHLFLPTVTLDPNPGNDIVWGATVPTAAGSYIYTSFPPLGFLIPYAVLKFTGSPFDFYALAIFNSLIGLVAAIGMGILAREAAMYNSIRLGVPWRIPQLTGWWTFLAASTSYLFLRESLQSHGAAYWPHSISQVFFIYASWLAFRIVQYPHNKADIRILLTLCLLYPLLEWTGFIFNIGLCIALYSFETLKSRSYRKTGEDKTTEHIPESGWRLRRLSILILGVSLISGLVIAFHLFSALGADQAVKALIERAQARSGSSQFTFLLGEIPDKYWHSFTGLIALCVPLALLQIAQGMWSKCPAYVFLLWISIFPVAENLVMLEHAFWFSFDRLKLAVPMMIIVITSVAALPGRLPRAALPVVAAIIIFTNITTFRSEKEHYSSWYEVLESNNRVAKKLASDPDHSCAVYASTGKVRGYLNLLFDTDIYEFKTYKEIREIVAVKQACGSVTISHRDVFPDLPEITNIDVHRSSGDAIRYEP